LVKRMGEKPCLARRAERCLASQVSDAQQRQARFLAHSLRVPPRRPHHIARWTALRVLSGAPALTAPPLQGACALVGAHRCAGRRHAACNPCSTTLPARDMAGTLCLKDMSTRPSY
ncbi:MAG: hypothetical protein WA071_08350, partial [Undibacterium umbellatum]